MHTEKETNELLANASYCKRNLTYPDDIIKCFLTVSYVTKEISEYEMLNFLQASGVDLLKYGSELKKAYAMIWVSHLLTFSDEDQVLDFSSEIQEFMEVLKDEETREFFFNWCNEVSGEIKMVNLLEAVGEELSL